MPPAAGPSLGTATLRATPEDFIVEEIPSWQPSGSGEHDVLHVRKRDANTQWVAARLAEYAGCSRRDVSYAGLKDRHAVTSQWFSVHRPGRTIDWSGFQAEGVSLIDVAAHHRKIKIGSLIGNRFRIVLRFDDLASEMLDQRIEIITDAGMPNYFGPQRFGHNGGNIVLAEKLAEGARLSRQQRGFALSAARAGIFNAVVAARLTATHWLRWVDGDVMMLEGSQSVFDSADESPEALETRLASGDVHITAPLWGRGALSTSGEANTLEAAAAARHDVLCRASERGGAKMQRRALRVMPKSLVAELDSKVLTLGFELPAGAYATSLINEICETR